mmetsp:Transcript_37240/g.54583  ORF Transcript_37240/g.54583 Transcript_37240/m.54583 type:complete len:401 (+) Transcript_37240:129-1331(+)
MFLIRRGPRASSRSHASETAEGGENDAQQQDIGAASMQPEIATIPEPMSSESLVSQFLRDEFSLESGDEEGESVLDMMARQAFGSQHNPGIESTAAANQPDGLRNNRAATEQRADFSPQILALAELLDMELLPPSNPTRRAPRFRSFEVARSMGASSSSPGAGSSLGMPLTAGVLEVVVVQAFSLDSAGGLEFGSRSALYQAEVRVAGATPARAPGQPPPCPPAAAAAAAARGRAPRRRAPGGVREPATAAGGGRGQRPQQPLLLGHQPVQRGQQLLLLPQQRAPRLAQLVPRPGPPRARQVLNLAPLVRRPVRLPPPPGLLPRPVPLGLPVHLLQRGHALVVEELRPLGVLRLRAAHAPGRDAAQAGRRGPRRLGPRRPLQETGAGVVLAGERRFEYCL